MKRLALLGLLMLVSLAAQTRRASRTEYPTPNIREEQSVQVQPGQVEMWRLEWITQPKPVLCGVSEISLTCPCNGFAYGEGGQLDLVRTSAAEEVDRLQVTPFFEKQFSPEGIALLQRWQPDYRKDLKAFDREEFLALISQRPVVQVMHLGDYDHDGNRSEFYLQTETAPCGKSIGVVIGVSKKNPRLHAFGTASHPDEPLHLGKWVWDALRDPSHPVEVVTWPCDDHGAETRTTVLLHWTADGIDGTSREFKCMLGDKPGRLIRETPL